MGVHIYQIVYSAESRSICDPGFQQLDNLSNERPDWREYWPIRNYLSSHELDESSYYGFLSPRFREKTGLSSESVCKFIEEGETTREVFLFSPYFDQLAFFRNIFLQGEAHHPGLARLSTEFFERAGLPCDLSSMVSCSKNSVFSNYIVARPSFWRAWFEITEALFRMAEDPSDPLCSKLNAGADYHVGAQSKLFLLERIASYVLQRYQLGRIKAYPLHESFSPNDLSSRFFVELVIMDSLKFCYLESGKALYLEIYERMRVNIQSLLGLKDLQTGHGRGP
jgi:hypothetical protein